MEGKRSAGRGESLTKVTMNKLKKKVEVLNDPNKDFSWESKVKPGLWGGVRLRGN